MTTDRSNAPETWPGQPFPAGATYDGSGTNFALFSEAAEAVELCLLDEAGNETRVEMPEVDAFSWHVYLPGIGPGQRYGYRVHGPWAPARGHRFNPAKLLLDPYGKAFCGRPEFHPSWLPYRLDEPDVRDESDSAPHVPHTIVHQPFFDWGNDRPPGTPMHESVIYEVHVKGFTKLHPDIPENLRGTYAGLAHPAAIEYLQKLGVTAVELMPVHQFVHPGHVLDKGLRNYWGYDSIGFLAPHNEYAARGEHGEQVQEFKHMVRTLHEAGIEVILDVVYNHTAEGNHLGPMLSFKGTDNRAYYRLVPEDPRHYYDTTGTGNSMNMRHPHTTQLIMDSLRYWILEMHVDGFRFDLAATLARELHEVDRLSSFFELIQQDPVVSQVKLIAEPWDLGEGGYQVGNFPPLWSEWNGKYRDTMRDYWRGVPETLGEFAARFTGSSDLYNSDTRRPTASINFVTAHDGFTLNDLVSYDHKRNEANGEGNRDGESHNRSWNCGAEGPSDDPEVLECRRRQRRNFMASLLLSQGVPMLLGGDEFGRTQHGNNNAYAQDNELSWFRWEEADEDLLSFTRRLVRFRHDHPVFRRRRWFQGRPIRGVDQIAWLRPDGEEMGEADWDQPFAGAVGVFLNGEAILAPDRRGRRVVDDSYLLLFNACDHAIEWTLPPESRGSAWERAIDTARGLVEDRDVEAPLVRAGEAVTVEARSLVVLERVEESDAER